MYEEECKGSEIRSKVQWIGEKSTNIFLQLEKKRQSNNVIYKVNDKAGNIVSSNLEVLNVITDYYENLYMSQNIDITNIESYLDNIQSPKLSLKQQ